MLETENPKQHTGAVFGIFPRPVLDPEARTRRELGTKANLEFRDYLGFSLPAGKAGILSLGFIIVFCFLISTGASASTLSRPPTNLGIRFYWPLDEGAGTKVGDFSGNKRTGSVSNTSWVVGKFDKALSFNGSNSYAVSPAYASSNFSALTISMWVKRSPATGEKGVYQYADGLSSSYPFIYAYDNSGSLTYYVDGGYNLSGGTLTNGQWTHIVVTLSGDSWKSYKNGAYVASYDLGTYWSGAYFWLGNGYHGYWNGVIDDVRLYTRALSAVEVRTLYQSGSERVRAPSNQGLVGYWSFEDGSGDRATDFSGNGNAGKLVNNPAWTNGKLGKALSFDGVDDYVSITDSSSLKPTTAATVSAWVKTSTPSTQQLIFDHQSATPWYGYNCQIYTSKLYCNFAYNSNGVDAGSNFTFIQNTWYHIVSTYNGANIVYYVNGVLDKSTPATGAITYTVTQNPTIGNRDTSFTLPFNGLIDDVRIYNRALSAAEVKTLYQTTGSERVRAPSNQGLVGYWSFEDGSGDRATDFSGNGNYGKFPGGTANPTWVNGKQGKALSFDGVNDRIDMRNLFNFSSIGGFSTSAWIKTDSSGALIITTDSWIAAGNQNSWIFYVESTGKLKFFGYVGDNDSEISNTAVNDGKWHHVAMTYNNKVVTFYLDGVTNGGGTASSIGSGNMSTATYGTVVGANFNTSNTTFTNFFNGFIDDVRIYNRALSAQEVQQLYLMGK